MRGRLIIREPHENRDAGGSHMFGGVADSPANTNWNWSGRSIVRQSTGNIDVRVLSGIRYNKNAWIPAKTGVISSSV
jgi:hypothetical protein